jgi:hypothetical protein
MASALSSDAPSIRKAATFFVVDDGEAGSVDGELRHDEAGQGRRGSGRGFLNRGRRAGKLLVVEVPRASLARVMAGFRRLSSSTLIEPWRSDHGS